MNVYDKAHELAKALKDCPEVAEVKSMMNLIAADADSKRMLDEFRAKQAEMQQKMMTGDMPNPEEMEKMEKMFELLQMNQNISRLFDAERRLSVIIEDINKIVLQNLEFLYQ
ncbi:YlbF family regulator [Paenibacillus guangzhouensis]|uniref:YlbF family regulator n=1 Tax=Paenibacillus guangzhouensis TaxID=1473112 RepID=UPI001267350A|nr:YlbF family regulator [Paenibacillus guangzhouensis]